MRRDGRLVCGGETNPIYYRLGGKDREGGSRVFQSSASALNVRMFRARVEPQKSESREVQSAEVSSRSEQAGVVSLLGIPTET